jgi:hypothetical protein
MLPGFRFLFAAIILSMSILVFGLGAAALLRAAHEEFASTPPWHAAPETGFAQQSDANPPVLAMLRVDPPVAEKEKMPDNAPAATAPAEPAAVISTPAEAVISTPAESATTVALPAEDSPPPETAKPQVAVAEAPPPGAAVAAEPPASGEESGTATTTAATEQAQPVANVAAPTAAEPAAAPADGDNATPTIATTMIATTTIATLGGPPVTIAPAVKAAGPSPDADSIKKREQARRAIKHRRMVARARLAAQAAQQAANPFAPPGTAVRSR